MPQPSPRSGRVQELTGGVGERRLRRGTEQRLDGLAHYEVKIVKTPAKHTSRRRGECCGRDEATRVVNHGHRQAPDAQRFVRQGSAVVDIERRCAGDRPKATHLASNLSYHDKVMAGDAKPCAPGPPGRRRLTQSDDDSQLWPNGSGRAPRCTHRTLGKRMNERAMSMPSPFLRAPDVPDGPPYPRPTTGRMHFDEGKGEGTRRVEGKRVPRAADADRGSPIRHAAVATPVARTGRASSAAGRSTPGLYFGGPAPSPSPRVISPAHPVQPERRFDSTVYETRPRGFSVGASVDPPSRHVSLRRMQPQGAALQKPVSIISWS